MFHIDKSKLLMRFASLADAERLFYMANDPIVRLNSFSPEPLIWLNHLRWFELKLANKDCLFYVYEFQGVIVAQTRYDKLGSTAEVDLSVASEWRGKGLGTIALNLSIKYVGKILKAQTVIAKILIDNNPSLKTFLASGFQQKMIETKSGFTYYVFERKLVVSQI